MFSAFGLVTRVQLVNVPDKEFASFILIHFNDASAVSDVLQKKNNIVIDGCKFNISEPKVKNDESNLKIDKSKNQENRTIKISNIEPVLDVNGVTKSDEMFYVKTDVVNGRLQQRNSGKTPFPAHVFHIIRVKEAFRYSKLRLTLVHFVSVS